MRVKCKPGQTRQAIERRVSRFKQLMVLGRFSPSETPIYPLISRPNSKVELMIRKAHLQRDTESETHGFIWALSNGGQKFAPHQLTFLFQARTLRLVINPHQPQEGVARSGGATRRLYILLYISLTQPVLMYFLTRHLNKYT